MIKLNRGIAKSRRALTNEIQKQWLTSEWEMMSREKRNWSWNDFGPNGAASDCRAERIVSSFWWGIGAVKEGQVQVQVLELQLVPAPSVAGLYIRYRYLMQYSSPFYQGKAGRY